MARERDEHASAGSATAASMPDHNADPIKTLSDVTTRRRNGMNWNVN